MSTKDQPSGFTSFMSRMLAKASPSDIKDMLVDAQMSKAFDIVEAGAESLNQNEFVPDLWAAGEGAKVPTNAEIPTGPEQASSGDNAQRQISQYSRSQVTQHGLTAMGTQMGNLVARVGAMEKSIAGIAQHVSLLSSGVVKVLEKSTADEALAKAAAEAAVAKAAEGTRDAPQPAAKSDWGESKKKEEEDDEDEDDKKAKSLMVSRANAQFLVAKGLVVKAEEAEGDGLAGTAKSRRDEARAALAKANTLLTAAGAMGAAGEDFDKLGKTMNTFAIAKSMQDVYPDSAKGSDSPAAKAVEPSAEDAVAKAQEAMQAKANEIQAALEGFAVMKSDIQTLMQTIAGTSRSPGGVPNTAALAKGDPMAYARGKSAEIMRLQDEGVMSNEDIMAANDVLMKMQAAGAGAIPAAAVSERLRQSSTVVKSLFQDAA